MQTGLQKAANNDANLSKNDTNIDPKSEVKNELCTTIQYARFLKEMLNKILTFVERTTSNKENKLNKETS